MVLIAKKGEKYSFVLPDDQAEKLGLAKGKQYELTKIRDGFFALYEGMAKKSGLELDKKILSLLRAKKLSDRVEGRFEEYLTGEERQRLKELIREGRIVPFKLSERYKKAVYKTREEVEQAPALQPEAAEKPAREPAPQPAPGQAAKKPEQQPAPKPAAAKPAAEKPMPAPKAQPQAPKPPAQKPAPAAKPSASKEVRAVKEALGKPGKGPLRPMLLPSDKPAEQEPQASYSLERDDFTVISSDEEARQLSRKMGEQIRKKEVLGTKSFDGDYFVIKASLYEKHSPEVLNLIKGTSPITAGELSKTLNLNKELVKAICEFLKEEGEITEKRKEIYGIIL